MIDDHESRAPKFPVLTPQILRRLPDVELLDAIYDHAVWRMGAECFPDPWLVDALPEGVRAVWAVRYYDGIMGNGGLCFVLMPGEPTAERILEGLQFVRAKEHEALLAEAMDVWARNKDSVSPYYVEKEYLGFHPILGTSVFKALHERYWGLPKLDAVLVQMVRANLKRFCSP